MLITHLVVNSRILSTSTYICMYVRTCSFFCKRNSMSKFFFFYTKYTVIFVYLQNAGEHFLKGKSFFFTFVLSFFFLLLTKIFFCNWQFFCKELKSLKFYKKKVYKYVCVCMFLKWNGMNVLQNLNLVKMKRKLVVKKS